MKKTTILGFLTLISILTPIPGAIAGLYIPQTPANVAPLRGQRLFKPKIGQPFYNKTTIQVAEQLKLPKTLYGLRDKAQDFIIHYRIENSLDVQSLRTKDLNYRASGLEFMDVEEELALQERFDREFERIDRELLSGARLLDLEEASFQKKADFIKLVKADAIRSINSLIARYRK